jgi:hypothetical protein
VDVVEREIVERFQSLRPEQQRQVRDFVARLAAGHPPMTDVRDHALAEWLSPEEDAAWEHSQVDGRKLIDAPILQSGASGEDLRSLTGTISPDDLDVMERVIEEDCERIDLEDW